MRTDRPIERWEDDSLEERGDQGAQIAAYVEDKCQHAADERDEQGVPRARTRRDLAKLLAECWFVNFPDQHGARYEVGCRMLSAGDSDGDVLTVGPLDLTPKRVDELTRVRIHTRLKVFVAREEPHRKPPFGDARFRKQGDNRCYGAFDVVVIAYLPMRPFRKLVGVMKRRLQHLVHAFSLGRDGRHDLHPKLSFEVSDVDVKVKRLEQVDLVKGHDDWKAEFEELQRQIQVSFEPRGVNDINDGFQ